MTKIVIPKNELKAKVGNGGFDEKKVQAAQKTIDENEIDFMPIASQYLAELHRALTEATASQNYQRARNELLDVLTQLRAQGSMFHFSSVTAVTDVVVDLLDSIDEIDGKILEITAAYERSALLLLKSGIKKADHVACQSIVAELQTTCRKYQQRLART